MAFKIPCGRKFAPIINETLDGSGDYNEVCGKPKHFGSARILCPNCEEIDRLRRQIIVVEMERDHARKRWDEAAGTVTRQCPALLSRCTMPKGHEGDHELSPWSTPTAEDEVTPAARGTSE